MDQSNTDEPSKPEWWQKNERLRQRMGLPPYEPPRFEDGTPTFRVTDKLESEYDCTIRFMGKNTTYPDSFVVTVDGAPLMRVGRHRDHNANTVYEMDAARFREQLEQELTD
ncbi:MAG: hypothetical protein ABEH88_04770 [Halobacteriales archaeon]